MRISIHAFPICKAAALPLVRPVWCVDDDDDDDDLYLHSGMSDSNLSQLIDNPDEIHAFLSPSSENFGILLLILLLLLSPSSSSLCLCYITISQQLFLHCLELTDSGYAPAHFLH